MQIVSLTQNLDNMKSLSQKIISYVFLIVFVFTLFTPIVSYSQQPTPQSPNQVRDVSQDPAKSKADTGIVYECDHGTDGECNFNDLIEAVRKVINWGTIFALQFSVVVIAWAGFRYMKSGDNAGERTKANEMLWKVVVGIFFILTAWVIVTLLMNVLVDTGQGGVPLLLK